MGYSFLSIRRLCTPLRRLQVGVDSGAAPGFFPSYQTNEVNH